MTTHTITVKFNTDAAGYVTQQCGRCQARFKVDGGNKDKLTHCPHCGETPLRNPNGTSQAFLTDAQAEYGMSVAAEALVEPQLQQLEDKLRNLGRASRHLKVKVTGHRTPIKAKPAPSETEGDMPQKTVSTCCSFEIRHEADAKPAFCGECGGRL